MVIVRRELRAEGFSEYIGNVSASAWCAFRVLRIERRIRSVPMRIATIANSTTSAMRRFTMVGVRLVCESSRTTKLCRAFIMSVSVVSKRVWYFVIDGLKDYKVVRGAGT